MFSRRNREELVTCPELVTQTLDEYCPETGNEQILYTHYQLPAQRLFEYLGACPATAGVSNDVLTRFEWQIKLAGESMRTINALSLQKYKNLSGTKKWHWHRAAWHRGLFWGLGELIKNTNIYLDVDEIDLLDAPMPDTGEGTVTCMLRADNNRELQHIHPMALELGISQSVSPLLYADSGGMDRTVWLYTQNSYWEFNSRINPIVRTMEMAVGRTQQIISSRTPHDVITTHVTSLYPDKPISQVNESFIPGKRTGADTVQPGKSESRMKKQTRIQLVSPLDPPAIPEPDVPSAFKGRDPFSIKLSQWVESSELKINCSGASLHVTPDNQLGVTYPQGVEQLAMLNQMTTEALMTQLEKEKLLMDTGHRYFFNLPKTKNKDKCLPISLVILDKTAMSSYVQHLKPNPIMTLKEKD